MENENLVEKLREGNEEAYSYLMDNYYTRLCVYAETFTKDCYKAEDIVQNVMLKLWLKRDQLSSDYQIKNYLYKSVYNEFIDRYREYRILTPLEEKHVAKLNNIVQDFDFNETEKLIQIVKNQIENLPPKCKAIFKMSKMEGLSYTEIAEYQNISIKTVENQIAKAFQIIRAQLGEKYNNVLFIFFDNKLF
ncbi:RNA polymerase sigma factor [Flavobacterium flavipallidum]|uniref:RNA polymerase sigma-70 factor n=1 Tax=Flavobacterium flavipallidum TaxID=3139140 RepID=A0ABU9HLW3_9FLAO